MSCHATRRAHRHFGPAPPRHPARHNRQDVFFVDQDYEVYLGLLAQHALRERLRIVGYCLMANHIHLIVVPPEAESLARVIGRTDFRYSQYINRLHKRSGHLWQNRFHSCSLDAHHLWAALAYVERNPVRARVVRRAWMYRWSSAAAHVGQAEWPEWLDRQLWARQWDAQRWRALLREPQDKASVDQLRLSTHRGRPLASDSLLSKLERKLGRRLRPLPVGRPRKVQKPATRPGSGRNSRQPVASRNANIGDRP
jgi:putative transposase